jgi:hypothetical protein
LKAAHFPTHTLLDLLREHYQWLDANYQAEILRKPVRITEPSELAKE